MPAQGKSIGSDNGKRKSDFLDFLKLPDPALPKPGPGQISEDLEIWKSGNVDPLGSGSEKRGFQTAWDITGQKLQGLWLKLQAFLLIFQDLDRHLCQKNHEGSWLDIRIANQINARWNTLDFQTCVFCGTLKKQRSHLLQNNILLSLLKFTVLGNNEIYGF